MENLKLDKQSLKKFGITMGIAFLAIALLVFFKHKQGIFPVAVISGIFFLLAFMAPGILKPLYIVWMCLAFILSWVNTRIILCAMFYFIFTPIGLFIRLCGKDLLDRKIEENKSSYWQNKEKKPFKQLDYERQF